VTINQLINEEVEIEFIKKEIEIRVDKDTPDQELLVWKHMEIDSLVDKMVRQQLEEGEFKPTIVAKMCLRWKWLKQQALRELELRGTMEVCDGVQ
jgi:hypothetical protein